MSGLTHKVQTRIDEDTKRALEREAKRIARNESHVVRIALSEYLKRKGTK